MTAEERADRGRGGLAMGRTVTAAMSASRQRALSLRLKGLPYSAIGRELGLTRQRIQQMTMPSKSVRRAVLTRAQNACEQCAATGKLDIHHRAVQGIAAEAYNAEANLIALCVSCHRTAHVDPASRERRRPKTVEEKAAAMRQGAYKRSAAKLGISFEEYSARREGGERWCNFHKAWESSERFGASSVSPDGLAYVCAEGNRESVRLYQTQAYKQDYYRRNSKRMNAYHAEWLRKKRAS